MKSVWKYVVNWISCRCFDAATAVVESTQLGGRYAVEVDHDISNLYHVLHWVLDGVRVELLRGGGRLRGPVSELPRQCQVLRLGSALQC